ncbi:SIS domain-containing protein [Saitoella complicata NRRL Y-17804]|uniref:SIS domain-containing protein n=1 Tax=Saitoella complicata (strain BCRC 22490 / CBS 7301 / JCM 7358 / NBRC 10748 / NRRL Y-17804) TaxID=698492 RepID=UPI0008671036|nr:SIS domain-containing protein [Saitoella complicata NRRL Y-17804]ODQ53271.1 SIS domain-containing protein [Saitoella complicata NRRL Y-17804]
MMDTFAFQRSEHRPTSRSSTRHVFQLTPPDEKPAFYELSHTKPDTAVSDTSSFTPSSSASLASRILAEEASALQAVSTRLASPTSLTVHSFNAAIALISHSLLRQGKIILTGLGKSGIIARKIAATCTSTGSPAIYLHPCDALHGDLGIVRDGDVCIAISHSGRTREVVELIPHMRARGCPIIMITGCPEPEKLRSEIGVDIVIDSQIPHNQEVLNNALPAPTTSTTLVTALGDAIAWSVMFKRTHRLQMMSWDGLDMSPSVKEVAEGATPVFARNHPGGALGVVAREREVEMGKEMRGPITPPNEEFMEGGGESV